MKQHRYEQSFRMGVQKVGEVVDERGGQYRDTLEEAQWLTLIGILEHLTGVRISNDSARVVALAALADIKYWRQLGPFKLDTLIDRVAHEATLTGELDRLESKPGSPCPHATDPTSIDSP